MTVRLLAALLLVAVPLAARGAEACDALEPICKLEDVNRKAPSGIGPPSRPEKPMVRSSISLAA